MKVHGITRIMPLPKRGEVAARYNRRKPRELTKERQELLLIAAEYIDQGMTWDETEEGQNYWSSVKERLMGLANGEPVREYEE